MYNGGLIERQSRLDWLLLLAIFGLMVLGVVFVYSATMTNESAREAPWYTQRHFMQMIWYAVGLAGAALICVVDYHTLARWSLVAYWGTIVLLLAVLVPGIGSTHGWGARRWIDVGPFGFQPSEFAKLSFIFAQSHYLSRPQD